MSTVSIFSQIEEGGKKPFENLHWYF